MLACARIHVRAAWGATAWRSTCRLGRTQACTRHGIPHTAYRIPHTAYAQHPYMAEHIGAPYVCNFAMLSPALPNATVRTLLTHSPHPREPSGRMGS